MLLTCHLSPFALQSLPRVFVIRRESVRPSDGNSILSGFSFRPHLCPIHLFLVVRVCRNWIRFIFFSTFHPNCDESANFMGFSLFFISSIPSFMLDFAASTISSFTVLEFRCSFASFNFDKNRASCLYWFSLPFLLNT